jgi:hypothetical protein
MSKVSIEVAEAEIKSWLDYKKILESTRETHKEEINVLIEAITEGILQYNSENHTLTHNLLFPFTGEMPIEKLVYQPRINDNALAPNLKGVELKDLSGRLNAYIATLTKTARGLISALDSVDKKIANAIVIFFI